MSLSFYVIRDCLLHGTVAVQVFCSKLIGHLQINFTVLKHVSYFSDGPAAQYKNFKNFKNLCKNHDDIGISAEWNFFASSHGKSPCGGIGGTTKQLAARANLQRSTSDKILTPSDLFRFCGKQLHGIKFLFITKQEIEAGKKI